MEKEEDAEWRPRIGSNFASLSTTQCQQTVLKLFHDCLSGQAVLATIITLKRNSPSWSLSVVELLATVLASRREIVQGIGYVAWWGALVATLVLLLDVTKWLKSGPRIKQRIQLDITYPDSRVLSVEKLEHGESRELASYGHIELVNTGILPTTIMGISATHDLNSKMGKISFDSQSFTPHNGKTLPLVLSPGEVWSCRVEMLDLYKLAEWGRPYIEVTLSHKRKPIVIRPKLSANNNIPAKL